VAIAVSSSELVVLTGCGVQGRTELIT